MKHLLFVLPIMLGAARSQAQSIAPATFNASGGSATVGGNVYDWSIGEMVLVSTASTPNLIVTQGLLQPASHDAASSVLEQFADLQSLSVYPNPSENVFYVESKTPQSGQLQGIVKDMTGKSVMMQTKQTFQGQPYRLTYDISALAAGPYVLVLQFMPAGKQSKPVQVSYKIEKIH